MLDKNKDGRVNLSEMKTMLSNLGIRLEDCVVEALIKQASERGKNKYSIIFTLLTFLFQKFKFSIHVISTTRDREE